MGAEPAGGPAAERAFWAALNRVPGLGPRRLACLVEAFGSARAVWEAPAGENHLGRLIPEKVWAALLAARESSDPEAELARLESRGVAVVTRADRTYPAAWRGLVDAPPVLYVRGDLGCLDRLAVAVVGTRRPTPYGLDLTSSLAGDLAAAGVVVVSGLAVGIDGAAHQSALDAGGPTVAVLGSGLENLYPPRHASLAGAIARHGAVVTQFPPETKPDRSTFVRRNFVIAALAAGVVVVEAPAGSGALLTAAAARKLGRSVWAVPGPVTSPCSAGCLELLRAGARAAGDAGHVLADLGLPGRRAARTGRSVEGPPEVAPSDPAAAVLTAMGPGEVVPFATLEARTGLGPRELGALLGRLEVGGLVRRVPGPGYCRRGPAGTRPDGGGQP